MFTLGRSVHCSLVSPCRCQSSPLILRKPSAGESAVDGTTPARFGLFEQTPRGCARPFEQTPPSGAAIGLSQAPPFGQHTTRKIDQLFLVVRDFNPSLSQKSQQFLSSSQGSIIVSYELLACLVLSIWHPSCSTTENTNQTDCRGHHKHGNDEELGQGWHD